MTLAPLAGVRPGDRSLAARAGRGLSRLPGRWRWAVERMLRWWLGELAAMLPAREFLRTPAERIGADDSLEFTLALVPAALGLVEERVALALAAQTPFAPDEVLAAYRLDPDGTDIRVTVRAAPLARLAPILSGDIDRIVLEGGGPDMTVPVPDALAGAALRHGRRAARRRRVAVAGALALAAALPLLAPIALRQQLVQREQVRLDEARMLLAPSVRRAARIRTGEAAAATARAQRAAALRPLVLLAHLSERMGDDAYLTELTVAGRIGRIAGVADSAGALPGLLEADPMLAEVRLLAPVARDPDSGRQRFEIGFTVARR